MNDNSMCESTHASRAKHILAILASGLLVVLILFVGAKFINETRQAKFVGQDITPQTTVSVSAQGETIIKPNMAELTITVDDQAKTAAEAQQKSAAHINAIIAAIKAKSVDDKDIKTTSYNIDPDYDYTNTSGRILRGYIASQTLLVKVRNIDTAGALLTDATAAGANRVSGPNFTVDDETRLTAQRTARKDAIDKAQEQARQLARDLGVSLVRLVNFSESYGGGPVPMYAYEAKGMGGGADIAPQMPSGENKITTSVTLIYEIRS